VSLAIDGSTPAAKQQSDGTIANVVSDSFTPPDASLLLVCWSSNSHGSTNPSAPGITDSLGAHLTYNLIGWRSHADAAPVVAGQTAMWWAWVTTSAAMTVTVTSGAATTYRASELQVIVITGADPLDPIGASGKAGSAGPVSSFAQNYTAEATSGWGFLTVSDWDASGTATGGTGCTAIAAGTVPSSQFSYGQISRTTPDDSNGSNNTINVTLAGNSQNLSWVYAEVLPDPLLVDPDPPGQWQFPPWLLLELIIRDQAWHDTGPTSYIAPVLVQYTETDWTTTGAKATASISWLLGDVVVIIGGTESQSTTITPTATGLAFLPDAALTAGSSCWAQSWRCTATAPGTSVVTATPAGVGQHGIAVWVYRGSDGVGNRAAATATAKTLSLTRGRANAAVVEGLFDFDAGSVASRVWAPGSQTEREASANSGYSVFVADWADQGVIGTTSYGISGTASTGQHSKIALEIYGTATPATADATISPASILATTTIPLPTLPTDATVTPAAILTSTTLPAAILSAGSTVSPAAVLASTTIGAPGLSTGSTVSPASVLASTTLPAPTVSAGSTLAPATILASTTMPAPALSTGARPTPAAILASTTLPTPALSTGSRVSPNAIAASTTLPTPALSAGSTVSPAAIAVSTTLPAPAVTAGGNATVTPAAVLASTTLPAPTLSAGSTVTPAAVLASTTLPAPILSAGSTVTPLAVQATSTLPAPTLSAGSRVSPIAVAASTTFPASVVSAGSRVIPAAVTASTSLPAPTLSAGSRVSPIAIAAATSLPAPTLSASANVFVAAVLNSTTMPAPVVATGVVVTPASILMFVSMPAAAIVSGERGSLSSTTAGSTVATSTAAGRASSSTAGPSITATSKAPRWTVTTSGGDT
jgi:hypothetical protein